MGSIVFVAPARASESDIGVEGRSGGLRYGFPNLPVIWGYQTHKDEIDQAAERFYRCVKSYMVMRELVSRKRMKAYERIWRQAHFVHEKCTFEGQMTCAIARDLLSQAYLNDFLKS
ncbi:hypothetical protein [Pseudomonas aeruginosa]|uniref:hypothetical protein n=1 Tax=Pseudomonas aeruginosa TaxID=287 RepID=UPI002237B560|nr:hypothetical protein [Pseudomonas aeruginosa]